MEKNARIFVAGHRGLVGSALVRRLEREGFCSIVTRDSRELDLRNQAAVDAFFAAEKLEYVFQAAARVGGIHANNTFPADFIRDNLQIQTNVIDAAWRNGVRKLLFLGSSCIFPKEAAQPITEDALLTGPLEPTNEWYATAKIAGIKMCQAYRRQYGFDAICAQPTNLYGPGDNFHPDHSHVIPGLIRRFHAAAQAGEQTVAVWGTGKALREFLHVDDLADALVFLMQNYSEESIVNVGTGSDLRIADLAALIAEIVGFTGKIVYDPSMPDGTPRKLLDVAKLHGLGWRHTIELKQGLAATYHWYTESLNTTSSV